MAIVEHMNNFSDHYGRSISVNRTTWRYYRRCQSYGALLAQAYLAHRPGTVEQLILSRAEPANYGKSWLHAEYAAIALAQLLPEKTVKNMLTGGLLKFLTLPEAERVEWKDLPATNSSLDAP